MGDEFKDRLSQELAMVVDVTRDGLTRPETALMRYPDLMAESLAMTGLAHRCMLLQELRHTAGTLAARTGATTKELMARLGHASPQAANVIRGSSILNTTLMPKVPE